MAFLLERKALQFYTQTCLCFSSLLSYSDVHTHSTCEEKRLSTKDNFSRGKEVRIKWSHELKKCICGTSTSPINEWEQLNASISHDQWKNKLCRMSA